MAAVRKWQCALAMVMTLAAVPAAQADPFTFSLLPASGDIEGEAGVTIGWGYTITNPNPDYWLEITSFAPGSFVNVSAADALLIPPILAPGQTESVLYDPLTAEGLFQITWEVSAPVGFRNDGQFKLSGQFLDGDPFLGGAFLFDAEDQFAEYSATVIAPSQVPEPATLLMMGAALSATGVLERRRRRRQTT